MEEFARVDFSRPDEARASSRILKFGLAKLAQTPVKNVIFGTSFSYKTYIAPLIIVRILTSSRSCHVGDRGAARFAAKRTE
jgi:hypothetical protein